MIRILVFVLTAVTVFSSDVFFLCSYPRTANTWVRYGIETMFEYPTTGPYGGFYRGHLPYNSRRHLYSLADQRFNLPFRKELRNRKKIVLKMHDLSGIENRDHPLILILRDYKECIPSQLLHDGREGNYVLTICEMFKTQYYYFDNIRLFDQHKNKKLLIYYEDLISNPLQEFKKIAAFLGASPSKIKDFLEKKDEHKKHVLKFYQKEGHFTPKSGGDQKHFSKNWKEHEIKLCDDLVKRSYPDVWKYLRRYAK